MTITRIWTGRLRDGRCCLLMMVLTMVLTVGCTATSGVGNPAQDASASGATGGASSGITGGTAGAGGTGAGLPGSGGRGTGGSASGGAAQRGRGGHGNRRRPAAVERGAATPPAAAAAPFPARVAAARHGHARRRSAATRWTCGSQPRILRAVADRVRHGARVSGGFPLARRGRDRMSKQPCPSSAPRAPANHRRRDRPDSARPRCEPSGSSTMPAAGCASSTRCHRIGARYASIDRGCSAPDSQRRLAFKSARMRPGQRDARYGVAAVACRRRAGLSARRRNRRLVHPRLNDNETGSRATKPTRSPADGERCTTTTTMPDTPPPAFDTTDAARVPGGWCQTTGAGHSVRERYRAGMWRFFSSF